MGPAKVVFLAAILCVCGVTIEAFKFNSWIPKVFKEGRDSTLMELKERNNVGIIPREFNSSLIEPREFNSSLIEPREFNSSLIEPRERNLPLIQPKGKKSPLTMNGPFDRFIPKDTKMLECGTHNLSPGQTVTITSKNYPSKYPKKYQCTWNFMSSAEDSKISISCSTFKLRKCKQSFVKITGGSLNEKYCGNKNGMTASSTTNRMKIYFRTKGKKTKKGFSCQVTASGDCVDENEQCSYWASIGECEANPAYMLFSCRKSCLMCGDCVDENEQCSYWASIGECEANPAYMLFSCRKSCLMCDVTTTTTTYSTTATPSSGCKSCGTVNRATRIVGGVVTEVNEYPWQVALVYAGTNSVFCGGSVYNDRYIVTAAHCGEAINDYGIDTEVLLGAHDMDNLSSGVQRISVSQIIIHPDYNSNTLNNDIALLKLSSAATLNDIVKPACLPDPSNDYDDVNAIVSGWGTTSEGGSQPSSLMEVEVPTMSNADCQDSYGSSITENMICAGFADGGKDSCQGDSGGPMAVEENGQWVLVGVVSWGVGCARPGSPGVYARVTQYLSWLASNTAAGGNNLCSSGASTTTITTTTEAPSSGCKCGHVNTVNRIVGGNPTDVHEYPWQVALTGSNSNSPYCGGSIISNQWILTAAHCGVGVTPSNSVVVIGEHITNSNSETSVTERRTISQIVVHPNYSSSTIDNDMALIKLQEPIVFNSDNKIAPVCLPPSGNLYSMVDATITGWGTTSSGGSQPATLQEVTVPTMSNAECQTSYGSSITSNMICAGLATGGKDSCQGDSGGPMVTSGNSAQTFMIQIGVVSWGSGCAEPNLPGVYARVNNYLSWISTTTAGSSTCPSA